MSPDSVSSLFPDRPIRPLPKRRLRERLSPDVADAIKYPLEPPNNAPLFYYPYNLKAEAGAVRTESANVANRENSLELAQEVALRRNGHGLEHDEDRLMYQGRRSLASRPLHDAPGHILRTPPRAGPGRRQTPQGPPSTASSADGYDSFENTNNKKKRKIPTAGEGLLNGTHALTDSSILGVPSPPTTGDESSGDGLAATPSPYPYGGVVGSPAQGISGPGRGRYGRVRNGRSPLRQVPDTNMNWPVKNSRSRSDGHFSAPPGEKIGIISNAIASAGKLPVPQGQENISLLQQQSATKGSPSSAQFTFTFDSQASGTIPWPGSESSSPEMAGRNTHQSLPVHDSGDAYYSRHSRSTQHGGQSGPPDLGSTQIGGSGSAGGTEKGPAPANSVPKKPKRRGNPLLQAAKQRRQDQEDKNYSHPPAPEDIWMCEFCEYERIFGRPPEALIRQYEIKDRRRRREEAERRRLLEKAKMKSRKGKKPSKASSKNNAVQDRNATASLEPQAPLMESAPSQDTRSDDYEEDDYYEDDAPDVRYPTAAPSQNFEAPASPAGDVAEPNHDHQVPVD